MSDFLPTADFDAPFVEGQSVDAPTVAPTDGERLMRFQRYRDERAFAQVVETHANMVWSVCSQILRHQQDVEDAFQATFLILARKSRSIRATESAAGWLYRVAYRTALLAHSRHRRRSEAPLLADIPSLDDQLTDIERNEQAMRLLDELNSLPARYQQPLVLCYMEGRTRSEAAEQLGVSTQTIKGLLARGTRLLRSRLIRRGVALSAALGIVQSTASSAPAAAPGLVSLTATLGMGFAVKSKIASVVIKGAPLKGVAACSLAEKGILAMTIAAASKPAVGVLGVCLAVGMLAVAEADPPKGKPGGDGNMVIISTSVDGESGAKAEDVGVEDGNGAIAKVQTLKLDDVVAEVKLETSMSEAIDLAPADNVAVEAKPTVDVTVEEEVEIYGDTGVASEDGFGAAAHVKDEQGGMPPESHVWQLAEAQPQVREFRIERDFNFAPQPTDVLIPRFAAAGASPMATGSEATLKLEGEYWSLKAEGLKKKAAALELKASEAKAVLETGAGAAKGSDVLELESEQQLALAEVKLCEMNAQRVRETLEAQAAAKEASAKKNVQFQFGNLQAVVQEAESKARAAQKQAAKAVAEAKVAATVQADRVQLLKKHEFREARPAKKGPPAMEVRPGVVTLKASPASPTAPAVVLTAPPAPAPSQFSTAPLAPPLQQPAMSIIPQDELKKLLEAAEKLEKLQQRLEELEKEKRSPVLDEVEEEGVKE